jgi:UDP-N-acetylmuramoylalanine--D-glutamate ligase
VVVVGAARSGIAAAELLASRGARVLLSEMRPALEQEAHLRDLGVEVELGGHRVETLTSADLIVMSPGVPMDQPPIQAARRAGVPVIGEIELASRWLRGRLIAITGTKGKSTTTTLAARILAAGGFHTLVGGNIGVPLSAEIDRSTPDTVNVVEVSSFQLEATETFHPWVAVLLNFSPDHLDRHPSVEAYAEAKARIFANQTESDWAVINADDPQALALARKGRARQLRFALESPIEEGIVVSGDAIVHKVSRDQMPLLPLSVVRLTGRHLLADVLAATAVGRLAGVAPEAMVRAVEAFTGLEHAMEPAGEVEGVRFVNDSKATNIESARRSIESFAGGVVPIMGGRFKGGDFRSLRDIVRAHARAVIAIGEARGAIQEAFKDLLEVRTAESMESAVRSAFAIARPDGIVLLAPACASFDMFTDYAERGRVFKGEVARLAEERTRREQ